jgi:hypothetical protein
MIMQRAENGVRAWDGFGLKGNQKLPEEIDLS